MARVALLGPDGLKRLGIPPDDLGDPPEELAPFKMPNKLTAGAYVYDDDHPARDFDAGVVPRIYLTDEMGPEEKKILMDYQAKMNTVLLGEVRDAADRCITELFVKLGSKTEPIYGHQRKAGVAASSPSETGPSEVAVVEEVPLAEAPTEEDDAAVELVANHVANHVHPHTFPKKSNSWIMRSIITILHAFDKIGVSGFLKKLMPLFVRDRRGRIHPFSIVKVLLKSLILARYVPASLGKTVLTVVDQLKMALGMSDLRTHRELSKHVAENVISMQNMESNKMSLHDPEGINKNRIICDKVIRDLSAKEGLPNSLTILANPNILLKFMKRFTMTFLNKDRVRKLADCARKVFLNPTWETSSCLVEFLDDVRTFVDSGGATLPEDVYEDDDLLPNRKPELAAVTFNHPQAIMPPAPSAPPLAAFNPSRTGGFPGDFQGFASQPFSQGMEMHNPHPNGPSPFQPVLSGRQRQGFTNNGPINQPQPVVPQPGYPNDQNRGHPRRRPERASGWDAQRNDLQMSGHLTAGRPFPTSSTGYASKPELTGDRMMEQAIGLGIPQGPQTYDQKIMNNIEMKMANDDLGTTGVEPPPCPVPLEFAKSFENTEIRDLVRGPAMSIFYDPTTPGSTLTLNVVAGQAYRAIHQKLSEEGANNIMKHLFRGPAKASWMAMEEDELSSFEQRWNDQFQKYQQFIPSNSVSTYLFQLGEDKETDFMDLVSNIEQVYQVSSLNKDPKTNHMPNLTIIAQDRLTRLMESRLTLEQRSRITNRVQYIKTVYDAAVRDFVTKFERLPEINRDKLLTPSGKRVEIYHPFKTLVRAIRVDQDSYQSKGKELSTKALGLKQLKKPKTAAAVEGGGEVEAAIAAMNMDRSNYNYESEPEEEQDFQSQVPEVGNEDLGSIESVSSDVEAAEVQYPRPRPQRDSSNKPTQDKDTCTVWYCIRCNCSMDPNEPAKKAHREVCLYKGEGVCALRCTNCFAFHANPVCKGTKFKGRAVPPAVWKVMPQATKKLDPYKTPIVSEHVDANPSAQGSTDQKNQVQPREGDTGSKRRDRDHKDKKRHEVAVVDTLPSTIDNEAEEYLQNPLTETLTDEKEGKELIFQGPGVWAVSVVDDEPESLPEGQSLISEEQKYAESKYAETVSTPEPKLTKIKKEKEPKTVTIDHEPKVMALVQETVKETDWQRFIRTCKRSDVTIWFILMIVFTTMLKMEWYPSFETLQNGMLTLGIIITTTHASSRSERFLWKSLIRALGIAFIMLQWVVEAAGDTTGGGVTPSGGG
jgi:hypothetical protein